MGESIFGRLVCETCGRPIGDCKSAMSCFNEVIHQRDELQRRIELLERYERGVEFLYTLLDDDGQGVRDSVGNFLQRAGLLPQAERGGDE